MWSGVSYGVKFYQSINYNCQVNTSIILAIMTLRQNRGKQGKVHLLSSHVDQDNLTLKS